MRKNCRIVVRTLQLLCWLCGTGLGLPATGATGGVQAKLTLTLGTHDNLLKAGLYTFAAARGDISIEAGAGVWLYRYTQRYGAAEHAWGSGYETFALVGAGDNENLLGSTASLTHTDAFYRPQQSSNFIGLGVGISRDKPQGSLRKFAVRRGHALLRVATNNSSLHVNFANDFRSGFFRGAAKDQGPTGSLHIGYARTRGTRLQRYAVGFDVFTPQPDYARAPSNPMNSGDGAKRSWYTTAPWDKLFHANLYGMVSQQRGNRSWSLKAGADSSALGAFVQNRIHDSFGLYPRYPWPVAAPTKPFLQAALAVGDLR